MKEYQVKIDIDEEIAVKIQRVRFIYNSRKSIINAILRNKTLQTEIELVDYYQNRYEESYIAYKEMLEAVSTNYLSAIKEGRVKEWMIDISTSQIIVTIQEADRKLEEGNAVYD